MGRQILEQLVDVDTVADLAEGSRGYIDPSGILTDSKRELFVNPASKVSAEAKAPCVLIRRAGLTQWALDFTGPEATTVRIRAASIPQGWLAVQGEVRMPSPDSIPKPAAPAAAAK